MPPNNNPFVYRIEKSFLKYTLYTVITTYIVEKGAVMRILSTLFICSLFVLSCANPKIISVLQEDSAGQMPCDPSRIEIVEHQELANGDMTWTGLCLGDTYQCRKEGGAVSCSKMASQFPN